MRGSSHFRGPGSPAAHIAPWPTARRLIPTTTEVNRATPAPAVVAGAGGGRPFRWPSDGYGDGAGEYRQGKGPSRCVVRGPLLRRASFDLPRGGWWRAR